MRKLLIILAVGLGVAACGSSGMAVADPSGVPMPTAPAGYKRVLASDFTGRNLGCWSSYYANPIPSSPTGAWEGSHVTVYDGMAVLSSSYDRRLGKWVSGGMSSSKCLTRTYGIYEVRFKMQPAPGVKYAILLWPQRVPWPDGGEIDFGEDGGGNRSATILTNHYGRNGVAEALPYHVIPGDFARWNTLKLVWTAGNLVEYINGRMVAHISSPEVPSDPMALDIQTETNTVCGMSSYTCISSRTPATVDLDVDWAVAFAPLGH